MGRALGERPIRKVHDFLTVGSPAPLQEGVVGALEQLGRDYYDNLACEYQARRDILHEGLVAAGFRCAPPQGAYFSRPELGRRFVRFAFCKTEDMLRDAARRLREVKRG